jgi:hypothetical protein
MSLKISEILEKAADALDERGWIQGDYGVYDQDWTTCAMCAYGALYAVSNETGSPYLSTSEGDLAGAWLWDSDLVPAGLVNFNDDVAKTKEEVTGLFRSAAAKAKEENL